MNSRIAIAAIVVTVVVGTVFAQTNMVSANGQTPLTAPSPITLAKRIKVSGTALYKIVKKGVTAPAPNVIITLKNDQGVVVAQTVSDANGFYSLEATANTQYFVINPFSRRGIAFTPSEKQIPAGEFSNVNFYGPLGN